MAGDVGVIVLDEVKDDNSAKVSRDDPTFCPFDCIGVLGIMRANFLDDPTDIAVGFVLEDEAVEHDRVSPCRASAIIPLPAADGAYRSHVAAGFFESRPLPMSSA